VTDASYSPVVVDTNILFSALLRKPTRFSEILLQAEHRFYVSESVIIELFRHKERILRLSRLNEDELVHLYQILLRRLHVYKEDLIAPEHGHRGHALCRPIDETDTPHVALALELNALLWTSDKALREGPPGRGFDRFFGPHPALMSLRPTCG
jgi:predicted nucleic acid-binding protein